MDTLFGMKESGCILHSIRIDNLKIVILLDKKAVIRNLKILSGYHFNSHSISAKRQKSVKKNAGEIANLETEIRTNSQNIETNFVRIQDNEDKISTNNEDITNNTAVII